MPFVPDHDIYSEECQSHLYCSLCNAKLAVKSTSGINRECRLCVRANHGGMDTIFGVKAFPHKLTPPLETVKPVLLLALSFFYYLLKFVQDH